MVKLGKRMSLMRCVERMTSHLLEGVGVAEVKKEIMYGVEIEALLYFRVRGK